MDFIQQTQKIGLNLSDEALSRFDEYYEFLIEENKKYNLTTITEREEVFLLHFFDSLTACSQIPQNSFVCDVGSGGGFPAIPLKIAREDINITMLDSVMKKVNFLNLTVSKLRLQNASAIHTRVEDAAKTKLRESFDVVTSRAVAKLPTLLEYTLPLVKVGGILICYKTNAEEELEISKRALSELGGKVDKIIDFDIDGKELKRSLIIIKKVSATPSKYPRGKNKERTCPL